MDQRETFLSKAPEFVTHVSRFYTCLSVLKTLLKFKKLLFWPARTSRVHLLIYGFVDSSKPGLGAYLETGSSVKYCVGCWGKDVKDKSSIWREFETLVQTMEGEEEEENLVDSVIILATNNLFIQSALYEGNSSSEKLCELIVRFRALEMQTWARILATHVSRKE